MKSKNETEKKLRNLQKMIVDDAYRRRDKVIAIDPETFEKVHGVEVKLKISHTALEAMRKDLSTI